MKCIHSIAALLAEVCFISDKRKTHTIAFSNSHFWNKVQTLHAHTHIQHGIDRVITVAASADTKPPISPIYYTFKANIIHNYKNAPFK